MIETTYERAAPRGHFETASRAAEVLKEPFYEGLGQLAASFGSHIGGNDQNMSKLNPRQGEELFKRADKILSRNAEVFALTYGALVVQLIKDYEDYAEVNKQLDKMGFSIGRRLIDDFLARSASLGLARCTDFREVGDVLAKIAFKAFLNITPTVVHSQTSREFSLIFEENPLAEFVELPEDALGNAQEGGLWYSNVLCGVIRGSLEMISYQVSTQFVSDVLRGDEATELRVRLIKMLDEEAPQGDD